MNRSGLTVLVSSCVVVGALGGFVVQSMAPSANALRAPAATKTTQHPAATTTDLADTLDLTLQQTSARVSPGVVLVQSSVGLGSGEIIDKRGYILTNYHVISDPNNQFSPAPPFTVSLSNGKTYPASVAGADPDDDLAVLRIHAGTLNPIALGNSSNIHVGQIVLAIGNPLGYAQTVTFGIISTLGRGLAENGPATFLPNLIQTSAPINPGNSGGALVDLQGRLIGIPTLAAQDPQQGTAAQGIGFAIPINRARFIADQIIKSGKVTNTGRAYLGISGLDVTQSLQQQYNLPVDHGVLIGRLDQKGPAARAGAHAGDVIVAINGTQVGAYADLLDVLDNLHPGQKATLRVISANGKTRTLTLTLGTLPAR